MDNPGDDPIQASSDEAASDFLSSQGTLQSTSLNTTLEDVSEVQASNVDDQLQGNLTENRESAVNQEFCAENQELENFDTDIPNWEIEKTALTQANFNLNQELIDVKENLKTTSLQNKQLLAELSQNSREIIEATKQRRILETSRNEYSQRNIELESAVVRLRLEKEERDAAIVRLNKEKQMISLEVIATNDQLKQLSGEKAALLLTMETTQQERRTLAFEQERANADKDMQLETRRYLLREIAERDEKIIKQRLQMSSKEVEFVNERLVFERKIENFQLQIEELTEKLELSKNDGDNYLKRIEETERRFKSDISNLEAELRCQAEVANIHKNDLDEALQVAASLKDKVTSCEETLETAKSVLVEVQQELVTQREEFQANLAEKENCIEELKDELKKSNEMLKSKHAVHVNITEEELAKLSPAAAETAALLRGGHSYSSIIREHARLAGELAEARDIIKQLENDLHDICDDVRERAPLFLSQRNMLDASFDQNSALNSQLQEAEAERQKLLNERDAAKRELLFMRTELEKYQRDYARVTKQVHQLMFAAERAMHAADPDWNELDDEKLFTTIVQLQQRNIQLESDIEREKANATQIAMDTQDTERENLRKELKTAKEVEANLIEKASQLKSALDIVKSQSEHFQELIKDSVSATEARNCRLRAEEAKVQANVAELRAHRLEDYVKVLKEEHFLNEKLEASEMAAASIRQTNTALEVTLEMQKKSASEMSRELQARQKHVDKMAKDIEKLLATDAKRAGQVEELSRKLVDIQDQASTARIEKRSLQDELNSSKSEATRMRLEVDSLQKVVQREQLLMSSLSEVTARLSRIEAEKQSYSNTQLEALRLERDSLKSTSARLSDQLTHTRNEGKIIQARLEHELISLRSILSEKEQQKAVVDHELLDLRSKLVSIQEQYTQNDTIGMTPDRLKRECQQLKNRVQFLENQLDEVKNSLREAEADRVKRFDEKTLVEKHSGVLEENLKTTQQMGAMERERLEAKIISYEKRTSELAESVKLLREDREAAKSELLNLQISSDQETQNLKRQFDVANLQLEDVRSQLNETKASMQELQAEIDRKTFEISQINETANELQGNLIDAEAKAESLNAQLDCKIMALAAAQDAVKQADEQRAAATATLATKDAERDSLIRENREKLAEYEQKLNEIVQQYEAVALLTSQSTLETSMNPAPEGQSRSDNSSTALVESLQTVLQFVREEKEKAMTRSMNAEVEMRRLRAETAEYERGRSELLVRIRDLETERAANSVALVERSRLMEQIESLSSVQRENAQLSAEKLRLTKELSEAQKQKSLSEGRLQQLTGELHQNKINFTNASAEIRNRRRENELLKQRLQSTNTSASAALQSEIEELKKQFNQKVQELEVANEHATKSEKAKMAAEEEVKKSEMKCSQTRALAVKYRDETIDAIYQIY
ncbi:unnamed protein product [Caenorhabditis auriculariae]|uniref:Nucleoprotein TPR n=1 Tax=Caenorhabditis auriculariae TaxID=2777116 RepID=A0A8S1HGA6_9PELO|nr:unnamed protein product [Caenorhabditis auriculariae]